MDTVQNNTTGAPSVPPSAIEELSQFPHWLIHDAAKKPYNPRTLALAKPGDLSTCSSYREAVQALEQHRDRFAGVGYMFVKEQGITGVDLDHCVTDGNLEGWAQEIVEQLRSYAEVSPSGTGIHLYVRASLPAGCPHKIAVAGASHPGAKIELYDDRRYFTWTGRHVPRTPVSIESRQAELEALLTRYGNKKKQQPQPVSERSKQVADLSDHDLLARIRTSHQGAKFDRLWHGDTGEYQGDESRADLALCCMLAFWTGKDEGRIDRLFRQSGLMRDKWDRPTAGSTYGALTIRKALATVNETYRPGQPEATLARDIENLLRRIAAKQQQVQSGPRVLGHSLAELMRTELPPVRWIVPGIVPEGLTLLAGKPKLGKSWLAMHLSLAVAYGGIALGKISCDPGAVLYLALEDNLRRLKDRFRLLTSGLGPAPANFQFNVEWPRLEDGGYEMLEAWIQENPQARLIVIDTWVRVSPRPTKQKNEYELTSDATRLLARLAASSRIGIMLVHHMRKSPSETGDFLDEINGSTGLAGGADTVLGLKRARGQYDAELHRTGKDIPDDSTLALSFDKELALWTLQGAAAEVAQTKERQAILDLLTEYPDGLTARQISDLLGKNYHTLRNILARMHRAGNLAKKDSRYYPNTHTVDSVKLRSHSSHSSHSSYRSHPSDDGENDYAGEQMTTVKNSRSHDVKPPVKPIQKTCDYDDYDDYGGVQNGQKPPGRSTESPQNDYASNDYGHDYGDTGRSHSSEEDGWLARLDAVVSSVFAGDKKKLCLLPGTPTTRLDATRYRQRLLAALAGTEEQQQAARRIIENWERAADRESEGGRR